VSAAFRPAHGMKVTRRASPYLTPRELEVLAILTTGKTNREIATTLGLSVGTVKAHLSSIFAKLGVSNRTEAALVGSEVFPMLRALAS
jgi:DNA-binding NarL/FixJ family response regulator